MVMYSDKLIARFNSKWRLDKRSGCWVWTGARVPKGYGFMKLERKRYQEYAHRIAYRLFVGEIPSGKHVLHRCDSPPCVNPEHLFIGDAKANAMDMAQKGRHLYGERNAESVLTADQVIKIRQLCEDGETQHRVAALFGVAQMTVSRIVRRERWKHIK